VYRFSTVTVMQFKHHFRVRRPADRSPLIQPVLLTPGHGSYPAGHGTQGGFMAAILKKLTGAAPASEVADQLTRLADRIGENRVVAGLHYPEDIATGSALGVRLAQHFMSRTQVPGSALEWLWKKARAEWQ
jgi:membrane-associated phospholipid phosphatase